MEIKSGLPRGGDRPLALGAPSPAVIDSRVEPEHVVDFFAAAPAHHENLYRRLVGDPSVHPLEPLVEPSKAQSVVMLQRLGTEAGFAGEVLVGAHAVPPRAHCQP